MDALEAARDQSVFRDVNESLRDLNEAFEEVTRESVFVCECANRECMKQLGLTLAQYEEIRRISTHFIVAPGPGHVFPDVERVVQEKPTHFVVEKYGQAGVAAAQLDPRARQRRAEALADTWSRAERERTSARLDTGAQSSAG